MMLNNLGDISGARATSSYHWTVQVSFHLVRIPERKRDRTISDADKRVSCIQNVGARNWLRSVVFATRRTRPFGQTVKQVRPNTWHDREHRTVQPCSCSTSTRVARLAGGSFRVRGLTKYPNFAHLKYCFEGVQNNKVRLARRGENIYQRCKEMKAAVALALSLLLAVVSLSSAANVLDTYTFACPKYPNPPFGGNS